MATSKQRQEHLKWLKEITAIPTAAGKEDRVEAWIRDWVKARSNLTLRRDRHRNLLIMQKGSKGGKRPIFITAHMDHPAFVLRRKLGDRELELEFRGGVFDPYFVGTKINVYDNNVVAHRATITQLKPKAKPFKRVIARLAKKIDSIQIGDIARWAFPEHKKLPKIVKGKFLAHCCDDLAALAAGLGALDILRRKKNAKHVGLLLTRAEEVGFIGCIAACQSESVSRKARLICLENSRSFADSPVGGGPIVRVGDRMSVFSPTLTNDISRIMLDYAKRHPDFKWQRKLMSGGACEATAFSEYGYEATCICFPLENYHNMADIDGVQAGKRPAKIAPEIISVDDYHGMIELLVICTTRLDAMPVKPVRDLLDELIEKNGHVLT